MRWAGRFGRGWRAVCYSKMGPKGEASQKRRRGYDFNFEVGIGIGKERD